MASKKKLEARIQILEQELIDYENEVVEALTPLRVWRNTRACPHPRTITDYDLEKMATVAWKRKAQS